MTTDEPKIHFQDDAFIVLQKPSGWIVNEASTTRNQPVIQTWLKESQDFPLVRSMEFRSGIVHRLDKETSGALVVAKTEIAFTNIQSQFKERIVKKTYRALVHDFVEPREGKIDVPVGRLPWRRDRFGVLPGGRSSLTLYQTIDRYERENQRFTYVELYPETGRTHQIRIHMKHLNRPLVADEFYAGRKTARNDRRWCPRLFLHAYQIQFNHPLTGNMVSFEVPLAIDLERVLQSLALIT